MSFTKLEEMEVWQKGMGVAKAVYLATRNTSFDKDWGLRDQIRRAAVSIPSNIAEGFERGSDGDFNRFLMISKGSCGELRTQILLAQQIGYLDLTLSEPIIKECLSISSMIAALSRHLKGKQS